MRISTAGLTLTELTVVTAIFSVLTGLVFGTVRYQTRNYEVQSATNVTQSGIRIWLARMVKDLRRAGYDPLDTGNFGITVHTSTEIRFTTDANSDGTLGTDSSENVGYKFENGTVSLWLGGSTWRPILTDVSSLTFVYRDVQGNTVNNVTQDIAQIEILIGSPIVDYLGNAVSALPAPSISTSTTGDSSSITQSTGTGLAPMLVQVEKATLRNWK